MTDQPACYVYLATEPGAPIFVDVTPTLWSMEWIVKYGVKSLVHWEPFADTAAAAARIETLRALSPEELTALAERSNPALRNLTEAIELAAPALAER